MTKHVDIDRCNSSGYGVAFYRKREFSFGNRYGRNAVIFGCNLFKSVHATNRTTGNTLVLGKNITQGINGTTIYAEKCIQLILLRIIKNFV